MVRQIPVALDCPVPAPASRRPAVPLWASAALSLGPGVPAPGIGPARMTVTTSRPGEPGWLRDDSPSEKSGSLVTWEPRLAPSGPRDASMIVPLIKRDDRRADDAIVLPPESAILSDDLVGDLFIVYAFDLPGHFQYVMEHDRKTLGLDPGGLRKLSVANLTRLRSKPRVLQASRGAVRLTLDGNLEASLLLVDHLWPQLARGIAGETIVAVPARDCLVVSGTEIAGGVEALRQGVKRVWENPKTNPKLVLTRSLLVRRGGSWHVFEPA